MNDKTEQQYETKLIECVKQFNEIERYLQELEKQIRTLEAQNDFLVNENAEYQRKLSLITESRVGKIGMKLYHCIAALRQKGQ